jgi:ribonuclease P protein component
MLHKENRLTKKRDFDLVLKHGRWTNGRLLDLKLVDLAKIKQFFPKKEDPELFVVQLKVAFVVGLKIDKRAVVRNRIKRQVREVVRLLIKDNLVKKGFYLMFIAKKEIIDKDFAEISAETKLLLHNAGLLK